MSENKLQSRQETTLRDFLNVVFRRKLLIGAIVGLAAVLVFVLNARQPQVFESNARILVQRGEQSNAISGQIRYLGWAEEVASQLQVILSDNVFNRAREIVADSLATGRHPQHFVYAPSAVRADVVGESNAYLIRYVSRDPSVCQLGCEATMLAFQEYYRERQSPPELTDFFAAEIASVREDLSFWRDKRNQFLNEEKYFGMDETSKFLLGRIGSLEGTLGQLNGDISSQTLRVANLAELSRRSGAELESELAFSSSKLVMQSGIVQKIKFELQNLKLKREELLNLYTEKHPEVVAVNEQIAALQDDLRQQVENAYRVEQDALEEMRARRAEVVSELTSLRTELDDVPDKEHKLSEFDAMISKLESKHDLLVRRQSDADIAAASQSDWEVTILSHAGPPYSKNTRDYVRLALGPFLALIIALGVAFFLESVDHSLRTGSEVEEYLDAPVLATISEVDSYRPRKSA